MRCGLTEKELLQLSGSVLRAPRWIGVDQLVIRGVAGVVVAVDQIATVKVGPIPCVSDHSYGVLGKVCLEEFVGDGLVGVIGAFRVLAPGRGDDGVAALLEIPELGIPAADA